MITEPIAVIDIGSNTIHLLVGQVEGAAVLPLRSERIAARLGEDIDNGGTINAGRFRIAVGTADLFRHIAEVEGAVRIVAVATSAVRDATNGAALVEALRALCRLDVRLLTGEREAQLGYRGAMCAGPVASGQPVLLIDLGGGSAQVVLGEAGGPPRQTISLPLGSKRMTDKFCLTDPPTTAGLKEIRQMALTRFPDWTLPPGTTAVGVGGSARALRNLTRNPLTQERLAELAAEIGGQASRVFARDQGFNPSRSRVLPAAATTLAAFLEKYKLPTLTVGQSALREGVLLALAAEEEI